GLTWATAGAWLFLSWLICLTFIDLDTLTLPNVLTQSGLVLGCIAQSFLIFSPDSVTLAGAAHGLMGAIFGAVLGIWAFEIIGFAGSLATGKTVMGGGDGKLAAMLGAWLGWSGMLLSSFLACALGALIGGGAIALRLTTRQNPIPFGPFLALGALITLFWGDRLITWYLQFFFSAAI
ncbi:MAG: A24 family peptidase, partial [Cyanobacteria bacterium P01_C01_bin.147]